VRRIPLAIIFKWWRAGWSAIVGTPSLHTSPLRHIGRRDGVELRVVAPRSSAAVIAASDTPGSSAPCCDGFSTAFALDATPYAGQDHEEDESTDGA